MQQGPTRWLKGSCLYFEMAVQCERKSAQVTSNLRMSRLLYKSTDQPMHQSTA